MTHVREFHEAFGIPAHDRPGVPDLGRVLLRQRLIQEEFKEVEAEFKFLKARLERGGFTDARELYVAVSRLAKELADLRYVCWGADLEFGIPSDAVDREVHRSNMDKLWPDGKPHHRHDGKVIKPPNYVPADVLSVIGYIEGSASE